MYFDTRTAAETVVSLVVFVVVCLVVTGGAWMVARRMGHRLSRPALALVVLFALALAWLVGHYAPF